LINLITNGKQSLQGRHSQTEFGNETF